MINRDPGDEMLDQDWGEQWDVLDEAPEIIPVARVEIDLPYGEPFDWSQLSSRERGAIEEWQHEVQGWRARRVNNR